MQDLHGLQEPEDSLVATAPAGQAEQSTPGSENAPHPTLLQAPHCIPLVPSPLMSLSCSSHALPLGRRHPPQPFTHKGSAGFREKEGSSQIVRILFLLSTPPCWQQAQGPGHGEAKVMVMERLPWFFLGPDAYSEDPVSCEMLLPLVCCLPYPLPAPLSLLS